MERGEAGCARWCLVVREEGLPPTSVKNRRAKDLAVANHPATARIFDGRANFLTGVDSIQDMMDVYFDAREGARKVPGAHPMAVDYHTACHARCHAPGFSAPAPGNESL
jgi:hypothetical protein